MKLMSNIFKNKAILLLTIASLVVVLSPVSVSALTDNSERLPHMKQWDFESNNKCKDQNGKLRGRVQYSWISPVKDTVAETITLAPGKDSVNLWLNTATGVCLSLIGSDGKITDRDLQATQTRILSYEVSEGKLTIQNNLKNIIYICSNSKGLLWVKVCGQDSEAEKYPLHQEMTLSGLGSLTPGTHNISLNITQKMVQRHLTNNVARYECVAKIPLDNPVKTNGMEGSNCENLQFVYNITIIVPNKNDSHCNLLTSANFCCDKQPQPDPSRCKEN